jgi:hypothetical protein
LIGGITSIIIISHNYHINRHSDVYFLGHLRAVTIHIYYHCFLFHVFFQHLHLTPPCSGGYLVPTVCVSLILSSRSEKECCTVAMSSDTMALISPFGTRVIHQRTQRRWAGLADPLENPRVPSTESCRFQCMSPKIWVHGI